MICECAVFLQGGGSRTEYRSADDSQLMHSTLASAPLGGNDRADTCTWHGHGIADIAGCWQSSGAHKTQFLIQKSCSWAVRHLSSFSHSTLCSCCGCLGHDGLSLGLCSSQLWQAAVLPLEAQPVLCTHCASDHAQRTLPFLQTTVSAAAGCVLAHAVRRPYHLLMPVA